jgi:ABC-type proline/glycine betaine transport system permease subunit
MDTKTPQRKTKQTLRSFFALYFCNSCSLGHTTVAATSVCSSETRLSTVPSLPLLLLLVIAVAGVAAVAAAPAVLLLLLLPFLLPSR